MYINEPKPVVFNINKASKHNNKCHKGIYYPYGILFFIAYNSNLCNGQAFL